MMVNGKMSLWRIKRIVALVIICGLFLMSGCNDPNGDARNSSDPNETETVKHEEIIDLFPGISTIIYENHINYHSPDLYVSQAYPIMGKEEEQAILCFFMMNDNCVGTLLWYGDLKTMSLNMEGNAFYQTELDNLTQIYREKEEIAAACVNDNTICIISKEGKTIVLDGKDDETIIVPEVTAEEFQSIYLRTIYREPILGQN